MIALKLNTLRTTTFSLELHACAALLKINDHKKNIERV